MHEIAIELERDEAYQRVVDQLPVIVKVSKNWLTHDETNLFHSITSSLVIQYFFNKHHNIIGSKIESWILKDSNNICIC